MGGGVGGRMVETCKHNLGPFIHFPVLVSSSIITGGPWGRGEGGDTISWLVRKLQVVVNLSREVSSEQSPVFSPLKSSDILKLRNQTANMILND